MNKTIRIGTRESQLAIWQATRVKGLLAEQDIASELVYIKSEGDIDLQTPLYELGVQGIFTRSLDSALLNNRIDIAVHSLKDVPTQLPNGIIQCAVLKRGSYKDLFIPKEDTDFLNDVNSKAVIATSSIRRKAQWLHRYPNHTIENLRGNVNTRLQKIKDNNWQGAVFAAAGVERINLRPANAVELDWMLPAPAQGAVVVVCREKDNAVFESCHSFNDADTELCTKLERDFLRALMGGCSTPISALAQITDNEIVFKGNIYSLDGKQKMEIEEVEIIAYGLELGAKAANRLLQKGAREIVEEIKHAEKK